MMYGVRLGSNSEPIALQVVQGSDQLDSLGHLIFTIGYRILKKRYENSTLGAEVQ